MAMKGDRRVWLCNETGRPLVGRLDKARSDANAALERWHRGAIVRVEHIERRAGIGRIENSTRVELIRPIPSPSPPHGPLHLRSNGQPRRGMGEGAYSNASREDFSKKGRRHAVQV